MSSNGDQPAFPLYLGVYNEPKPKHHHGLTKREYFAIKLMAGMMAQTTAFDFTAARSMAGRAVEFADILLERLEAK